MKRAVQTLLITVLLLSMLLTSCSAPSLDAESGESTTANAETIAPAATKSEEPATEEIQEQKDPSADNLLNVLIIGNSFSTGWPDELNGLLSAAGVKAQIFSVYYSGCTLAMHWNWLQSGQAHYRLRHHKQDGGIYDIDPANLVTCLKQKNWDVISIQESFHPFTSPDFDEAAFRSRADKLSAGLYDYIREHYPKSKLVWFESWAYEVGWKREGHSLKTAEDQQKMADLIHDVSLKVASDNSVSIVPGGPAFQIARANGSGDLSRDGYHDGPENGGQYLNACVWFECLTGQSCIGNTWRPKGYTLTEERIALLQNAAHQAVAANPIK